MSSRRWRFLRRCSLACSLAHLFSWLAGRPTVATSCNWTGSLAESIGRARRSRSGLNQTSFLFALSSTSRSFADRFFRSLARSLARFQIPFLLLCPDPRQANKLKRKMLPNLGGHSLWKLPFLELSKGGEGRIQQVATGCWPRKTVSAKCAQNGSRGAGQQCSAGARLLCGRPERRNKWRSARERLSLSLSKSYLHCAASEHGRNT